MPNITWPGSAGAGAYTCDTGLEIYPGTAYGVMAQPVNSCTSEFATWQSISQTIKRYLPSTSATSVTYDTCANSWKFEAECVTFNRNSADCFTFNLPLSLTCTTTDVIYFPDGYIRATIGGYYNPLLSISERLKAIIDERCAPKILTNRKFMPNTQDIREIRARETLRRVIGEDKFRNFLKKGFVSVKGKSGKAYQIFPANGITNVYQGSIMVERLCVVLSGNFPPTDSIIMRYLLILNNEQHFRNLAIKHEVLVKKPIPVVDERNLVEIYKSLKAA
jgi:hypothetical protein